MKTLNKYKLEFDPTLKYVQDNLDKVNTLSIELLKELDFKNGYFFTLLPDDANFEGIYKFEWGGILPQNPIHEYFVEDQRATYSIKTSINNELDDLILKKMSLETQISYFIDKVTGTANEVYYTTFSDCNPLFYEKQVYFLINQQNLSSEVISKCLRASTSFWHSLSVFTTANLKTVSKTISLEKINEICLKTELVIVGAYDGEGYVFWEKNLSNANKGFFDELR